MHMKQLYIRMLCTVLKLTDISGMKQQSGMECLSKGDWEDWKGPKAGQKTTGIKRELEESLRM